MHCCLHTPSTQADPQPQLELELQLARQMPPSQLEPAGQRPPASQRRSTAAQEAAGLPVISAGQEQKALWFETVHSAQLPQLDTVQGSKNIALYCCMYVCMYVIHTFENMLIVLSSIKRLMNV